MKAAVTLSELTEEEAEQLGLLLADVKASAAPDDPARGYTSMEQVFAARIAAEVTAYVERARAARVEAQAKLGEVFIQLPEEERDELTRQLVERAQAHDIDVSGLTGGAP